MLSNTITHSGSSEFIFAMILSRETETQIRPHRPSAVFQSGQDKYELLLMDKGKGIFPSVRQILSNRNDEIKKEQYFTLSEWEDSFTLEKQKEESLLQNVLRGELVIRRGRRSEGLYEFAEAIGWFQGIVNIHSGRSELDVITFETEDITPRKRTIKNSYYLPGVITSAILPSLQVKLAKLNFETVQEITDSQKNKFDRTCLLKPFPHLPTGFFGVNSTHRDRRRSEIDCTRFIQEYSDLKTSKLKTPIFWEVNLQMSESIDIDFLDNFIQELAKRIDEVETSQTNNFFGIVFTNVPRRIIHALEKRNCHSFLMLKDTFCLLLDEADNPFFLGVPRLSSRTFELEDALLHLFAIGFLNKSELLTNDRISLSQSSLLHLERLLQINQNSLFYRVVDGATSFFVCRDILSALIESRKRHFEALELFFVREGLPDNPKVVFKLRNGSYVDSIIDYCSFWSDSARLFDCAKLLLGESKFQAADTIVTFMNNGDRLASAIQRFTSTPNLVILDPHDNTLWDYSELESMCILIIDAVYPGDERNGYIKDFIQGVQREMPPVSLTHILCFSDYRTGEEKNLFGIKVISVPPPIGTPAPKPIYSLQTNVDVVQNFQHYILSKPRTLPKISGESHDHLRDATSEIIYSNNELSTEFWQNVSAIGIVDPKQWGREDRNILFYENNERLIQNERLRRTVREFVSNFIKHTINAPVDVILHPTHAVGSYLAQLIAAQLSTPPVILPLTQRKYGGPIELTQSDIDYYKELLSRYKKENYTDKLTGIVVDDSVLTGRSLFTMLGVSGQLNVEPLGMLVLLSRLTTEVSSAFKSLHIKFEYLYRLHMPVLSSEESPDMMLATLNRIIIDGSNSYFAQYWARFIQSKKTRFLDMQTDVNPNVPPHATMVNMSSSLHLNQHECKHIINQLILHFDPKTLNFSTRVAITYNFLEQLTNEKVFWELLEKLFEENKTDRGNSQSIRFIQIMVYILAFSKFVYPYNIYENFRDLCCKIIDNAIAESKWVKQFEIVCECIMALGIIGSEKLLISGENILEVLLKDTMGSFDSDSNNNTSDTIPTAIKSITASLAWSIALLTHQKLQTVVDHPNSINLISKLSQSSLPGDQALVLIDILGTVLFSSATLRVKLGIDEWKPENDFVEALNSNQNANEMFNYLSGAPGYTCTLLSVLRICKADTILLYAKHFSDKVYCIKTFESCEKKRPIKELQPEHLDEKALPKILQHRMASSMFFNLTKIETENLEFIDRFVVGTDHQWTLGGPIHTDKPDSMSYYVVLGFKNRRATPELQRTVYYHWLKCEPLLRIILPQIDRKYSQSSAIWNTQIKALSPIHPINLDDENIYDIKQRKRELRLAMSLIDSSELLRRAVQMSWEPVYKLVDIQNNIFAINNSLQQNTKKGVNDILEKNKSMLPTDAAQWPIHGPNYELSPEEAQTFCALPMAVLEFITYECLCNALSYYGKRIEVKLNFNIDPQREKLKVVLIVDNDIHTELNSNNRKKRSKGINACRTAAIAVGGEFSSQRNPHTDDWQAKIEIPAYIVPEQLKKELYGYLK